MQFFDHSKNCNGKCKTDHKSCDIDKTKNEKNLVAFIKFHFLCQVGSV